MELEILRINKQETCNSFYVERLLYATHKQTEAFSVFVEFVSFVDIYKDTCNFANELTVLLEEGQKFFEEYWLPEVESFLKMYNYQ